MKKSRLAALLRQVRVDAHMTQGEVAGKIGQTQSYVSKYESGEQRLDLIELEAVCNAIGVPLAEFEKLRTRLRPTCPLPMNKQKGEKKNYAFLTGMVNMLIQANIGGAPCDYDPRSLTTMTHDAMPLRTLARRVDGAFPSVVNPV